MAKYRSLFISDVHLGTVNSQANVLLKFLKENDFENLFLVGDIIDIQQMKQKLFWKKSHNRIIQRILKIAKNKNVKYIYGNHDEFLSLFEDENFGSIEIVERMKYTTLKGEEVLILHGHQFDGVITKMKWLYWIGDNAYTFALFLNRWYNKIRKFFKKPYWSLSQFLKSKVKNSINFINDFEKLVALEAKKEDVKTVIAGHIHVTADREIDSIRYINCGCWTEYTSCVVETLEGDLKVIEIKHED
jgi:UDP-2,3-diacylglucosamine pyrophosphatase LpxH